MDIYDNLTNKTIINIRSYKRNIILNSVFLIDSQKLYICNYVHFIQSTQNEKKKIQDFLLNRELAKFQDTSDKPINLD